MSAPDVALGIPEGAHIGDRQTWVIEPSRVGLWAYLREFWRYRRITWFFCGRTLKKMYQRTFLGRFWILLRPLAPLAISTLIFGGLLGVPSDGVPYFLFFLAGSTPWVLFEQSLMWVTRSLEMNRGLVKKVYFPRLVVPVAGVTPGLVYFAVYITILAGTLVYFLATEERWYLVVGPGLLWAAAAVCLCVVFAIAVGLWTSVWAARARDVRFTLRYVLRFWFYLTPVIYPLSQVPEQYRDWIFLNPMAVIVETFKWGILGIGDLYPRGFGVSIGVILIILVGGLRYFTQVESASVDRM